MPVFRLQLTIDDLELAWHRDIDNGETVGDRIKWLMWPSKPSPGYWSETETDFRGKVTAPHTTGCTNKHWHPPQPRLQSAIVGAIIHVHVRDKPYDRAYDVELTVDTSYTSDDLQGGFEREGFSVSEIVEINQSQEGGHYAPRNRTDASVHSHTLRNRALAGHGASSRDNGIVGL